MFNNCSSGGRSCDPVTSTLFEQCSPTESCIPLSSDTNDSASGTCTCLPGTIRFNETHCKNVTRGKVSPEDPKTSSLVGDDSTSGGHVVVGILVPVFVISLVIGGAYFGRKYDLYRLIRSKIRQRSSNYDEVMIGQDLEDDDDPPLR